MAGHNYKIEYCYVKETMHDDGVVERDFPVRTKYFRNVLKAKAKMTELSKQNNVVDGELFFKGRSVQHFVTGV